MDTQFNFEKARIKQFELIPLGEFIITEGRTYAVIATDYRTALKNLELFSHALIFWEYKIDSNEYEREDGLQEFKSYFEESMKFRVRGRENRICVTVAKILRIDHKAGIIELDYVMIGNGAVIYDIKAYFPCEDRIKDCIVPKQIADWPEWRIESARAQEDINDSFSKIKTVTEQSSGIFINPTGVIINPIGLIRKRAGEFFLDLKNTNDMVIKSLHGFSHIRILWWFDRFDHKNYRRTTQCNPPYENAPKTGVFASRSPVRPNPLAMSTVRVLEVDQDKKLMKITGFDAFDKTPVIDIKPYIPLCDRVKEFSVPQWLRHWPEWAEDEVGMIRIDEQTRTRAMSKADIDRLKAYSRTPSPVDKTECNMDIFKASANKPIAGLDSKNIIIKGARQNNLQNISVTIPKNKMTVVTGVSGSGKSSLVFDTIYAESQRRFVNSITGSGRPVNEQMEKPDVEEILGLPPAVAIEQKTLSRNPRSTVGTVTDIYDYLRLLYAKIGTRHCPECGRAIKPLKVDEMTRHLLELLPDTRCRITAFENREFEVEFLFPDFSSSDHGKNDFIKGLKEQVKQGLEIGNGAIYVILNNDEEFLLQSKHKCYHCNRIFFELTTALFSFNHPEGMCPDCNGLGVKLIVEPELIVDRPELSILDGASKWWGNLRKHREKPNANWMRGEILALAEEMKINLELPWNELPQDFKEQALYGTNGRELKFEYENNNGRRGEIVRPGLGAFNHISRLFKENHGETAGRMVSAFMREKACPTCNGERLSAEGRLVTVADKRFPEIVGMTIDDLRDWVRCLPSKLQKEQLEVATLILNELDNRLQALIDVGVHYLTLDRSIPTLSGGEAQRIRLATQIGCGLTNLLYILDEPTMGLHHRDHHYLLKTLRELRDSDNTVLVVEHNSDTMLVADQIIDMGPGAGEYGGRIIAEGAPEEIMKNPDSITGKYLSGAMNVENLQVRRRKPKGWIRLFGAAHHNLQKIDVNFPIGFFTCVTGVSGSGKSSLVSQTLYPVLAKYLNNSADLPGLYDRIENLNKVDKVVNVNQSPIGRTPRSNPATYTGVFDEIRALFAGTIGAKKRGYKQSRFSFNNKEGRCDSCNGEGRKCIEMHFIPDVWVKCPECGGKRFNSETLEVKYKEKSIADVLEMDVHEALEFFKDRAKIRRVLQTLHDVGLDYIKLGQNALTLSGGEAQRIKLAKELSRTDTGRTMYILDEPTTGLHFADVQNLLNVIYRITEAGNTVVVIEHNLDMIINADYIIDLGPEGGNGGGYLLARGTPEEVAEEEASYTGRLLKTLLEKRMN